MDSGIRGSKKRTSPFTLPTQEVHNVRPYPGRVLQPSSTACLQADHLQQKVSRETRAPLPPLPTQLNFH